MNYADLCTSPRRNAPYLYDEEVGMLESEAEQSVRQRIGEIEKSMGVGQPVQPMTWAEIALYCVGLLALVVVWLTRDIPS